MCGVYWSSALFALSAVASGLVGPAGHGSTATSAALGTLTMNRALRSRQPAQQSASQQLEAAAEMTTQQWMLTFNASLTSDAQPVLAQIQQELAFTTTGATSETARQAAETSSLQGSDTQAWAQNSQAVLGAASEFARSRAQNAAAQVQGSALGVAFNEGAAMNSMRADAALFAGAAEAAEGQAQFVAERAMALSENVSTQELQRAEAFAITVGNDARMLQDEETQSNRLAALADQVSRETASLEARALTRALAANASAISAYATAQTNEQGLTDLHGRAQAAEQQASSASGGVGSVDFSSR